MGGAPGQAELLGDLAVLLTTDVAEELIVEPRSTNTLGCCWRRPRSTPGGRKQIAC